jgi:hypothetical protein
MAEAKAPQPTTLHPQTSQGVLTRSNTGTLGSATLLSSTPPALIPGGGILLTPPPPQVPVAVKIPPLPGEVLSLASFLPPSGGAKPTDDPSDFIVASHTQGHRTTPLHDAIVLPPNLTPTAVVNNFPSEFNLDSTCSNEGAQDNTLSTVNHASSEGGGVPNMKVDTSIQAVLDNYYGDPDFTTDTMLSHIREFVGESSKVLDSSIHSFCQEQTKNDRQVDAIIQDLHADCIDPESFVSTQIFDARIRTMVREAVDPFHKTLCKELDAMKCSYNAILTNFGTMMTLGNTVTKSHKKHLAKHQARLDQAATDSNAIQLALAQLGTCVHSL